MLAQSPAETLAEVAEQPVLVIHGEVRKGVSSHKPKDFLI
jgi:hypothetical protein